MGRILLLGVVQGSLFRWAVPMDSDLKWTEQKSFSPYLSILASYYTLIEQLYTYTEIRGSSLWLHVSIWVAKVRRAQFMMWEETLDLQESGEGHRRVSGGQFTEATSTSGRRRPGSRWELSFLPSFSY